MFFAFSTYQRGCDTLVSWASSSTPVFGCLNLIISSSSGGGIWLCRNLGGYNSATDRFEPLGHAVGATYKYQFQDLIQARALHGEKGMVWLGLSKCRASFSKHFLHVRIFRVTWSFSSFTTWTLKNCERSDILTVKSRCIYEQWTKCLEQIWI